MSLNNKKATLTIFQNITTFWPTFTASRRMCVPMTNRGCNTVKILLSSIVHNNTPNRQRRWFFFVLFCFSARQFGYVPTRNAVRPCIWKHNGALSKIRNRQPEDSRTGDTNCKVGYCARVTLERTEIMCVCAFILWTSFVLRFWEFVMEKYVWKESAVFSIMFSCPTTNRKWERITNVTRRMRKHVRLNGNTSYIYFWIYRTVNGIHNKNSITCLFIGN